MITKVYSDRDCHHSNGSMTQETEYYGLSTDTKPVDNTVPNAATFYEMDSKKLYIFDRDHHEWLPM